MIISFSAFMRSIGAVGAIMACLTPTLRAQSWHSAHWAFGVDDSLTVRYSDASYVKPGLSYVALRDSISVPPGLPAVIAAHYVTMCEGVYANAQEDYRHAESLFVALSVAEPGHPMGPLMHAATLNVEMVDNEVYDRGSEFLRLLDTASARADRWLKEHPDDAWVHCFKGHIYGYRAVWESRFGSWFVAMKRGLNARGAYHDALDRDSLLWDAFVGLGSYHYWKSARSEFINWLPVIVNDDKDKGLREMHVALERGHFVRGAAAAGLVAIQLHRKECDSALVLAREWQAVYRYGKAFWWGQAYALFGLQRWAEALDAWDSLRARVVADDGQGLINYVEIDWHRGMIYAALGDVERACAVMDTVLAYPVSDDERKRVKERLKDAEKFLDKRCGEGSAGD
jgi:tetratricopeptide (TPR) repeat protein